MIVTRELVERLERVEAAVVAADLGRRGDGAVEHRHGGVLAAAGTGYARAHAITLGALDDDDVASVAAWFDGRGADALVQLSAWAPEQSVAALAAAGAVPAWARAVYARPTSEPVVRTASDDVAVTAVGAAELDEFLATLATAMRGRSDTITEVDRRRARRELEDPLLGQWLARVDGEPVGAAIAVLVDGVAVLGPAGTLPDHRGRGVQRALLEERLVAAADDGADVAMVTTHAGTTSGRNAERVGFRLVQHQWVLRLARTTEEPS